MSEPTTKAGKALLAQRLDTENGVVPLVPNAEWIAAIEAEAAEPYIAALSAIPSRDSIVIAERERIAAGVEALDGACHDGEGLGCRDHPCVENVSRDAVLDISRDAS